MAVADARDQLLEEEPCLFHMLRALAKKQGKSITNHERQI